MSGAILENFAVSEIVESHQNCGREAFVYYYQDKDTKKIGVFSGKLYPMEIKKTSAPQKQLTRVFSELTRLRWSTAQELCFVLRIGCRHLTAKIWSYLFGEYKLKMPLAVTKVTAKGIFNSLTICSFYEVNRQICRLRRETHWNAGCFSCPTTIL